MICERPECDAPAIARVAVPYGTSGRPVLALVWPIGSGGNRPGRDLCGDCSHVEVDAALMLARPARHTPAVDDLGDAR